jgi:general secretion pathway protein H
MIRMRCHGWWSHGFTLIELLVVVFLIGLISGFAVLSISSKGDNREIEEQLQLLQYQLTMAGEESVVQGRPLGVRFEQGRYSFLVAGKGKWLELNDGKIFQPKELLLDWRFELQIAGESLSLMDEGGSEEDAESPPQIIFYSSGEIDPFELLVVDKSNVPKYRIRYGDDGVLALETAGKEQ